MSRVWFWLPAALSAALIWSLSGRDFSSTESSQKLFPLLRWLLPNASAATVEMLHLLTRKGAHVAEYFVFGLLLFRAVRAPEHGWRLRWAIIALLIAAAYSGLDELHQMFVPSRGPSGWDCLIDISGAAVAQLAAWATLKGEGRTGAAVAPRPL